MSNPIKNLPLIQNWSCHSCGDCCRIEAVITDEEKRRIEALDLGNDAEVAPKPWFAPSGRGSGKWKLRHRPDGGCVFLTTSNHCRLQERRFGADVKPFVCRLFPFVLIPAGNHWRVGMRFSCPSAAANSGSPVSDAEKDLVQLSRSLERHVGRSADSAPPPMLRAGQQLSWPDVCRIVDVLVEIVQDRGDRLERRLPQMPLAVARVCGQTQSRQPARQQVEQVFAGRAQRHGDGSASRTRGPAPTRPSARRGLVPYPAGDLCSAGIATHTESLQRRETVGQSARGLAVRQGPRQVPCLASTNFSEQQASRKSSDAAGNPPRKWMRRWLRLLPGQAEFPAILRAAQLQLAVPGRPGIAHPHAADDLVAEASFC